VPVWNLHKGKKGKILKKNYGRETSRQQRAGGDLFLGVKREQEKKKQWKEMSNPKEANDFLTDQAISEAESRGSPSADLREKRTKIMKAVDGSQARIKLKNEGYRQRDITKNDCS